MIDKSSIRNFLYLIIAPFSVLGVLLFLSSSSIKMEQEENNSAVYKINMETIQKSINTLQKVSTTGLTFLSSSN